MRCVRQAAELLWILVTFSSALDLILEMVWKQKLKAGANKQSEVSAAATALLQVTVLPLKIVVSERPQSNGCPTGLRAFEAITR